METVKGRLCGFFHLLCAGFRRNSNNRDSLKSLCCAGAIFVHHTHLRTVAVYPSQSNLVVVGFQHIRAPHTRKLFIRNGFQDIQACGR